MEQDADADDVARALYLLTLCVYTVRRGRARPIKR